MRAANYCHACALCTLIKEQEEEEEEEEEESLFKADAVNEEDSERDGTTLSPCYCVHCGGGGGEQRVC